MKTRNTFCALSLAVIVILFAAPPTAANASKLLDRMDQLDKLDQQDFQSALNKASDCTQARNFSCSEEQLRKAAKLANGSKDKLALNTATQALQAEQQRVRAEALAKTEKERQIRLAEERRQREEEQAEERRRRAQRERDDEESSSTPNAFAQGMQQQNDFFAGVNKIHNDSMQNINRIVDEKKANERAAREQRERNERAAAEQRAEERANQRAAADRRAQDNERARQEQINRPQPQEQPRYTLAKVDPQTLKPCPPGYYDPAGGQGAQCYPIPKGSTVQATSVQQTQKTQEQKITIPAWPQTCPPGYSPMRHANGVNETSPPGGACVKDPQSTSGQVATQGYDKNGDAGTSSGVSGQTTKDKLADSSSSSSSSSSSPKEKKIEWGPIQLEAIAICRQSTKTGKWECNGSLDNQTIVDEPTLESALARQYCDGGTWAAGGPLLDGKQWEAYRCNRSLGDGDYDVAKRYGLITARREYLCPKNKPFDGRCTTIYDGQDKR